MEKGRPTTESPPKSWGHFDFAAQSINLNVKTLNKVILA